MTNSKFPILKWEDLALAFESEILSQNAYVPSDDFNSEYFTGEWRHGYASYTLEDRRKIEGENPRLIKSVLAPTDLLDVGCGPGLLVLMLRELGVDATGVDASLSALETAPLEVQEHVSSGDILDLPFKTANYDVVVCREVLEHLTAIEVLQAIRELCRVSKRLIYLTTRFSYQSESLLALETEFDADPSHITCLNKSLVRTLFSLHGFRSRPDLETKMDWLKKERVLVYERTSKSIV